VLEVPETVVRPFSWAPGPLGTWSVVVPPVVVVAVLPSVVVDTVLPPVVRVPVGDGRVKVGVAVSGVSSKSTINVSLVIVNRAPVEEEEDDDDSVVVVSWSPSSSNASAAAELPSVKVDTGEVV
jgi:hypothetical protein